jgi:hypothetical protein
MEPKGDLEHEIVQLIDRRVARGFLKTIGLDMDFKELPKRKRILLDGTPHKFQRVIWAAHSLGTVISFNVIGDILDQCLKNRKEYASDNNQEVWGSYPEIERVERAVANLITFGSPIDKVCFLYGFNRREDQSDGSAKSVRYNRVLRKWPPIYRPRGKLDITKNCKIGPWWINVFYGSDPISGPLDTIEELFEHSEDEQIKPLEIDESEKARPLVSNISTIGMRLPLVSHTGYWKDAGLVTTTLSSAYAGYTKEVKHGFSKPSANSKPTYFFRSWPEWTHPFLSSSGLFWITIGLTYLLVWSALNWEQIRDWYNMVTGG